MKSREPSPLYSEEYGMLICPHCKYPLLTVETRKGDFKCVLCKKRVGRLSVEVMRRMLDDFPSELLREWQIEMEIPEEEETVARGRRRKK